MITIKTDEYGAPSVIKDDSGAVLMSFGYEENGVQFWQMDETQLAAVIEKLTLSKSQPASSAQV